MSAEEVTPPSPTPIAHFWATEVNRHPGAPEVEDLANAVIQIEEETEIEGASFIKVSLLDPEWALQTSGFIDVTHEGLIEQIEVEYPEKSGWFWRLCAVEGSTEVTQANLILTFEDRIIAWLRERWHPKHSTPGSTTRAQFIKALVDEVTLKDPKKKIRFRCPELNREQEVESTTTEAEIGTTIVSTAITQGNEEARANKAAGIAAGSGLSIKGERPDANQRSNINTVLQVCRELHAPGPAVIAILEAGIAESSFRTDALNQESGAAGVFQLIPATAESTGLSPSDTRGTAKHWLEYGYYGEGGGIALAKEGKSPGEIAEAVEGAGVDISFFEQFKAEAEAIINSGGGLSAIQASGSQLAGESDVSQLTRGTSEDPDEDSWEAITRLAKQVNWFAFTDGDTLFYMDGYSLIAQKPVATIDVPANQVTREGSDGSAIVEQGVIPTPLTYTFDNTTFEYKENRRVKGKVQHRSRIAKPTTPSEIRMNIVCEAVDPKTHKPLYRAGQVFEFTNSGPINGRWVVTDATRNVFSDTFTQLILEPPTAPLPEPQATTQGAELSGVTASAVATEAKKAYSEKGKYQYNDVISVRENHGTLWGPTPRLMDCSAFATLCYKAAGAPDPNGFNYHPIGNTQSLIEHMTKTSEPQPGDLAFFGPSVSETKHVVVMIGGGEAIGMESPGVNLKQGPVESLGGPVAGKLLGYWTPQ